MTATNLLVGEAAATASEPTLFRKSKARLDWIDHLRAFAIALVVSMHSCVSYSHVGSWYFVAPANPTDLEKAGFIVWLALLQSFFMGMLFFLAGFFADRSLARKGTKVFLKERWQRLGLPTLLYVFVLYPLIALGLNPMHDRQPSVPVYYWHSIVSGEFLKNTGPLWFAVALLVFCHVLAAVQKLVGAGELRFRPIPISGLRVILFGVALGVVTFFVRTVQPVGSTFYNMQLCFFPQYVTVFILGVAISRRDGLAALAASQTARRALPLALILGPITMLLLAAVGGIWKGPVIPYMGGWHWQALAYAIWEQTFGTSIALGLCSLFSRKFSNPTLAWRWITDRAFGVYVLHPPILVALGMLFLAIPAGPYALACLLTAAGLLLSFAAADLARRIPGLKAIL